MSEFLYLMSQQHEVLLTGWQILQTIIFLVLGLYGLLNLTWKLIKFILNIKERRKENDKSHRNY